MLCETFLNDSNIAFGKIEGYQAFHVCREHKNGGGVSVFIRNGIVFKRVVLDHMSKCTECLLIEVEINNKVYLIGSLYRIPNTSLSDFFAELSIITKIVKVYRNVVIGADQNLDLQKTADHDPTRKFYEVLVESELIATINKPTRVCHSSSTLIDNIYLKCKLETSFSSNVTCDHMSDHFPCILSVLTNDVIPDKLIQTRKLDENAISRINQRLLFTDWTPISLMDINEGTVFLRDRIVSIMDEEAPKTVRRINHKQIIRDPWMTVNLLKCNTKSRRLCKKAKISGSQKDYDRYKQYCLTLNQLKLSEKRTFYSKLFAKIGKNSKMLWEILNHLSKKSHNKLEITSIVTNGNKVVNPHAIANTFNVHFTNVGKVTQDAIARTNVDPLKFVKKVENSMVVKPISEGQLCRIVSKMEPKRSSGCDDISNFLLKRIISCIKGPFCDLINRFMLSGIFPESMKIAKIIPLHKSGVTEDPNNLGQFLYYQ